MKQRRRRERRRRKEKEKGRGEPTFRHLEAGINHVSWGLVLLQNYLLGKEEADIPEHL